MASTSTAAVIIIEQPAGFFRYRYESEGKSRIPGASSKPNNRTFPTIQILGYTGKVLIIISCVTKDEPHRRHPHNIVGNGDSFKHGIYVDFVNVGATNTFTFNGLGIQCISVKKDKQKKKRKEKTNESTDRSEIDLTVLRLKFEVFLRGQTKYDVPLTPVYSEPIYNATVYPSLTICRLSLCSCSTNGGETLLLFCDKVNKEDIAVRFFEEFNGQLVWEAFGSVLHVHRKVGIALETPKYGGPSSLRCPIKCFIQIKRLSDGETSEPRQFDYTPIFPNDFDSIELKRKRAKLDPVLQKFLNVEDSATLNRLNILPNPQIAIQQTNINLPINYDMFPVVSSDNLRIQQSNPFYLEAGGVPSYDIFPGTSTDYRKAPSPTIHSQANEFCFAGNNFTLNNFEGQQNSNFIQNFDQNPIDSEIIPKDGFSDELLAFVNEVIEKNNLDEEKTLSGRLENLMLDLLD